MLQDVFETLKARGCAIELKTNHRSESQLIVDNATRYAIMKSLHFVSVVLGIKGLCMTQSDLVQCIYCVLLVNPFCPLSMCLLPQLEN